MPYSVLQESVDSLRNDNRGLTDKLLNADGQAVQGLKDSQEARNQAKARRQAIEPLIPATTAERDAAQVAKTAAEGELASAQAARTATQDQPALAQTETARAVAKANAAEVEALGLDSGLASVRSLVQPSLVLDFAKGEYWKSGKYPWNRVTLDPATDLTFTRASTATYFDANGVLRTAAADEMRIDHDPLTGECLGVLIEPSRTNRIPNSVDLAGSRSSFKIEPADIPAPDGSMTAFKVTGVRGATRYLPGYATENVSYKSIWVRTVNGEGVYGGLNRGGYAGGRHAINEQWQRVSTLARSTSASHFYIFDMRPDDTSLEFYIWGPQSEDGPYPTSYIPTHGAPVTRASEGITVPDTGWGLVDAYAVMSNFQVFGRGPGNTANKITKGSNYLFYVQGNSHKVYDSTAGITTALNPGEFNRAVSCVSHTRIASAVNGGGKESYSSRIRGVHIRPDPLVISHSDDGVRYKEVVVIPNSLSVTELEELTT